MMTPAAHIRSLSVDSIPMFSTSLSSLRLLLSPAQNSVIYKYFIQTSSLVLSSVGSEGLPPDVNLTCPTRGHYTVSECFQWSKRHRFVLEQTFAVDAGIIDCMWNGKCKVAGEVWIKTLSSTRCYKEQCSAMTVCQFLEQWYHKQMTHMFTKLRLNGT